MCFPIFGEHFVHVHKTYNANILIIILINPGIFTASPASVSVQRTNNINAALCSRSSQSYDENLMHRENKISLTQQFKLCEKRCKSASDIV